MSVLTLNMSSVQLKMNTTVTLIMPNADRLEEKNLSARKVLWLLHGLSGDATSWSRLSRIEAYAEAAGLVVIMPCGGRSMYCDDVLGQNYFTHITEELPVYFGKLFGLSQKKEDNFIAGLSMGGYGAMKIALSYPERFAAVGSFSGLLDLEPLAFVLTDDMRNEFPFLIDTLDDISKSPLNPPALLDAEKDKALRIYVACGFQDDLFITNQTFKSRADSLEIDIYYEFEDGSHEWGFWDRHVNRFIEFMLGE